MTDEQIEKALECCCSLDTTACEKCPYFEWRMGTECVSISTNDAIALIRRQKQRIAAQCGELRRINKVLAGVRHSRDAWKAKAERVGKQLHKVLTEEKK